MGLLAPLLLEDDSSGIDRNHERSTTLVYTGYYTLDCDSNYVRSNAVVVAGNYPVTITDQHPTDPFQFVTNIDAKLVMREKTGFDAPPEQIEYSYNNGTPCRYWRVTIELGAFNPLEQSPTGIMTDMPLRYEFDSEDDPQPIFQDYSNQSTGNDGLGNPILNSAGQYFNPGIERLYGKSRLVVYRNETGVHWPTLTGLFYHTNQDAWNGFAKDTVLFKPVRSPQTKYCQTTGGYYQSMVYQFEIRYETWTKYVLDSGLFELVDDPENSGNKLLVAIKDEYGQPVSEAVPLDGHGSKLPQPIQPSDLVLLPFKIYQGGDYSGLQMDGLFTRGVGA